MRFDDTFTTRTDGSAVEFVPALSTPELRTAAVAGGFCAREWTCSFQAVG
jgi:hypothetical protein